MLSLTRDCRTAVLVLGWCIDGGEWPLLAVSTFTRTGLRQPDPGKKDKPRKLLDAMFDESCVDSELLDKEERGWLSKTPEMAWLVTVDALTHIALKNGADFDTTH